MKQEHHVKDVKNNGKGAVYDIDKELSGIQNEGTYLDSHNGRVSSDRGNKRSWEKIRGEELVFEKDPQFGNYECIGTVSVNDHIVEFWAENGAVTQYPIIRIDGDIIGNSENMPWLSNHHLQIDKNESCEGGEIFITDNNTPPMILNVGDMLNPSLGPETYFSEFNPDLYTVNLEAPLDIPVFKELIDVGGGGGLPVGSYQYSLRYVNEEGDRTNWGPVTNPIPVVQRFSQGSDIHPYANTLGSPANNALKTSFGVKLKFRVTNISNYDFIEIRRLSYNTAAGIDFVPDGEIIAQIEIGNGEISVREFVDPVESNIQETLSEAEETYQNTSIKRAKAIRYHDKRLVLMNAELEPREVKANFSTVAGKKIFPVVEKMGKEGHNDPYNHTNYKNYTSGEKVSFGAAFYDSTGGRSFVLEDEDLINVQAPNRREGMDSTSLKYSYKGASMATNINGNVSNTFEVFDHEDAISKTDLCSFKNITENKSKIGKNDPLVQNKTKSKVTRYCEEDPGYGSIVQAHEVGYQPFRPIDKNDSTQGHNYITNPEVGPDDDVYRPEGFGLNYYSKGFALGGLDNVPRWAKAFSIVRTDIANRVVCQGLGMYSINEADIKGIGNETLATKDANEFWFYSPDINSGFVNDSVLSDISDNPQNYSIQLVSPLGFFSEVYDFENSDVGRDRAIDMISYARVLHDEGQINVGENSSMGISDGSGKRFISYNRYRNTSNASMDGVFSGSDGNKEIDISNLEIVREGRGVYYKLRVDENIYQNISTGGTGNNDFDDQGMKDFTEPLYMVNIIQNGKNVIDQSIDLYRNTGTYQKIDSIIGESNGLANQQFELVDERWEDCIPALDSSHVMSIDEVYLYVENKKKERFAWMNSMYLSAGQISSITNDITTNGFYLSGSTKVYGLFNASISSNKRDFTILFNVGSFIPEEDSKIIISYDNRRPLRVFGGDSTIGEAIFSPMDRQADGSKVNGEDDGTFDDEAEREFEFQIGFPYRKWIQNTRTYSIIRTTGANRIQDSDDLKLTYIRQMAMMFTCESRSAIHYASSETYPLQYFPAINYVQRPRRWDTDDFTTQDPTIIASGNNIQPNYFIDFPFEWIRWQYGGFRFEQTVNVDYSVKGPLDYFSKPEFGFEDQSKICTGVFWSLPRQVNQQNSPGLKTFTSINRFDIDDDSGEIKKAWDTRTADKGENLYAITESGVCLLLTKKAILSNISGDDLDVTSQDVFVSGEYWISREVGSNDEMWRGMAEESIELVAETGRVEADALFMPNAHSVYRIMNNRVVDIAKDTYFTRINPILQIVDDGAELKMSGVFNKSHNEYWLSLTYFNEGQFNRDVFVYAQDTNHFVGTFGYVFDKFLFSKNSVYGMRGLETYELNKGFQINGENIDCHLIQRTSPAQPIEKEFIDFEVLTGPRGEMKPTRVEFLDEEFNVLSILDESIQGPLYLKQYDGWRQFIPRKESSVDPKRSRLQYRLLLYKIIHNLAEDFKIVDSIIQYKPIK